MHITIHFSDTTVGRGRFFQPRPGSSPVGRPGQRL